MKAFLFADTEHLDDVGVMQIGRDASLVLEALETFVVQQDLARQHLDGDPASQRLLLGLEDHPHAAAADLADEPEVTQPLGARRPESGAPAAEAGLPRLKPLGHGQGGEEVLDLLGEFRMLRGVVRHGRGVALPQALEVIGGQNLQGITFGLEVSHTGSPFPDPLPRLECS